MFDYSVQIEAFRDKKVRLTSLFKDMLLEHRASNRKRLISRLSLFIPRANIGESNFMPQGSVAMGTVVQTKFVDEEYDIDDGLVIARSQLTKSGGVAMTSTEVREAVRDALKDKRFNRQPKLFTNCVRVFYADTDAEKHHVDFPVYRKWTNDNGETMKELASETDWVASNPTQVNVWFNDIVVDRNQEQDGWGTQFRNLIQLLKRFCRSRRDWLELLPNGMKLSMLVDECQPPFHNRLDQAFRELLQNLDVRLASNKVIRNRAHPDKPMLTRSASDPNVTALQGKIQEALEQIKQLDLSTNFNQDSARRVWDWVFKSDGFFAEFDEATRVLKSESMKALGSTSLLEVPWKERPPWPLLNTHSAMIHGKWGISEHGVNWTEFPNEGPALEKHIHLRFRGETNVPKPYQVFWQVVNTGQEALANGNGRGQIVQSSAVGAGGLHSTTMAERPTKTEKTLYRGMHWVELYIVKNGSCWARSAPFVIYIK
jgi:hypothetical protein